MFGLTDDAIASIRAVLAKHPSVTSAVVFGSRALGRAHDWSDIDLSLSGTLNALEVERIAIDLEDLPLPAAVLTRLRLRTKIYR